MQQNINNTIFPFRSFIFIITQRVVGSYPSRFPKPTWIHSVILSQSKKSKGCSRFLSAHDNLQPIFMAQNEVIWIKIKYSTLNYDPWTPFRLQPLFFIKSSIKIRFSLSRPISIHFSPKVTEDLTKLAANTKGFMKTCTTFSLSKTNMAKNTKEKRLQ